LTPNKKLSMNNKGNIKSVPKAKKRANKKARKPRQPRNQIGGPLARNPRRSRQRTRGPGQMKATPRAGLSRRSCPVYEQEFIFDVIAGTTDGFAIANGGNPFPLNPGQATTFPWLSTIARQWEKYRFNWIEVEYMREVSEFATAGTIGKVMVHLDLNAGDPGPASKNQVLDTDERLLMSGMPCENFKRRIPGKLLHPTGLPLYVRPGGLPGASDIKTFDCANIWVSTAGTSDATTKLGELHIRYSVVLEVPVLDSLTTPPTNNSALFYISQDFSLDSQPLTSTILATLLWSADMMLGNGIGAVVNSDGTISLPNNNNYFIDWDVQFQATGSATDFQALLSLGGFPISIPQELAAVAAQVTRTTLSGSYWLSGGTGNGTLELQASATFSTGAVKAVGSIRIIAI
jgi:hypothetical protein